ncbi:MAG: thiol:disulfide interchange protein [Bacteroidales bacterium]|nr:thiol:disulfide interchange protein [Bacteroidales bacterium]
MTKKLSFLLFSLLISIFAVSAQIITPVTWENSIKLSDNNSGEITFSATIDDGWHMYGTVLPAESGIQPTTIVWDSLEGIELDGEITPSRPPHEQFDEVMAMKLNWWEKDITLTQKFKITDPDKYEISGNIKYMICNDRTCQPPTKEPFSFSKGAVTEPLKREITDNSAKTVIADSDQLWAPVTLPENTDTTKNEASITGLSSWLIFVGGFIGGLLALLTPCVWPMIPLTVSFFLKKSGSRSKAITNALLYGISIIVIYLVLGLAVTAIFGASALNALSTNAIFNIIFFLMLVIFAISFFGAFDIKLPDSWANKMDENAEKTSGLLSIFFMAFTLTLVSFSCTGPIIGTLLVEAANMGNYSGPAVGMFGFALALAIPFSLFAIFPSWLKEVPKSGGWMTTVKVTLGFIELALSLKFLSVADLAYGWGILDREVFVSLWIVIFALLGFYLLGKIRFAHEDENEGIGVFRFFLAMISLAFSIYLVPGLWGAPLKSVSAFVPPLYTQDFNLYDEGMTHYEDFDEGMRAAQAQGKPAFIDFSGYGCVNCRKMEASVLNDNKVKDILEKDFVFITLMVDDKRPLPEPIYVVENGRQVKLETYGDRWSYLQRYKFNANSQPYYAILDNNGELRSGPYFYNEDIDKFIDFLNAGKK